MVISVVLQELQGGQGGLGLLLHPHSLHPLLLLVVMVVRVRLRGADCLPVLEFLVSEEIHD